MKRLLLSLLLSASCAQAETPLAVWKTERAETSGDVLVVPEPHSGRDLVSSGPGVTLAEDPEVGKVVRFDGNAENTLATTGDVPSSDRLKIRVRVKLEAGSTWGSLIRFSRLELQHQPNRGTIIFVVWPEGQPEGTPAPEISLPHRIGEWITVEGTVDGNTMKLSIDGQEAATIFEGSYPAKAGKVYVGHGGGRPLLGEVAEVQILDLH